MARSRLTQGFKLYDWNKFSKEFSEELYKEVIDGQLRIDDVIMKYLGDKQYLVTITLSEGEEIGNGEEFIEEFKKTYKEIIDEQLRIDDVTMKCLGDKQYLVTIILSEGGNRQWQEVD